MKRNTKVMLTIGVLALCGNGGFDAALAQNKGVLNADELPPAHDFYHHRKKVQVVRTAPELTSVPPAPEPKQYMIINAPAQQAPAPEFIYLNSPGAGGAGLPPGVVDLSSPPRSGFGQSNIPANGPLSMRNKLPGGQTSNGLLNQSQHLRGRMTPGMTARTAAPKADSGNFNAAKSAPTQPLTYDRGTGSGGSTVTTTKTEVVGKLQRRSLLDKTK